MSSPAKYTNELEFVNELGEVSTTDLKKIYENSEYTVLYFYPKDNTSGCTIEAKDFTELLPEFHKYNAQVIGVSKDSTRSHCGFQTKQELKLGLIADTDTTLAQHFGAWGKKKFMGREYMGTFRNTYLLDKTGTILYTRENVSAVGHAQTVLDYIKTL